MAAISSRASGFGVKILRFQHRSPPDKNRGNGRTDHSVERSSDIRFLFSWKKVARIMANFAAAGTQAGVPRKAKNAQGAVAPGESWH
ncbi:hypothetical protein LN650_14405 [Klebsiella pneumoniae subsp. pneumoniae]|nr:hypothetical protein [Klebsiella pneumoniae subsp. pneumoniae]